MSAKTVPWEVNKYLKLWDDGTLTWRQDMNRDARAGDEAGTITALGYRQIGFKGKQYMAHHIVFFIVKGFTPDQIDHIDGNQLNNKFSNLRIATQSQNMMNTKLRSDNTSGCCGVYKARTLGKWEAFISIDKKSVYLGVFKWKHDAITARKNAEIEHYGEFRRVIK